MIHVRAEVRPSPIHGVGLFAVDAILAGELVYRFDPGFDRQWTAEQFDTFPQSVRDDLEIYGWRDDAGNWLVDIGIGRYRNHSFTPSVGADGRATRDIAAGEELTWDYSKFDPDWDEYAEKLETPISDEEADQVCRDAGIDVDAELRRAMALVDEAEAVAMRERNHER